MAFQLTCDSPLMLIDRYMHYLLQQPRENKEEISGIALTPVIFDTCLMC